MLAANTISNEFTIDSSKFTVLCSSNDDMNDIKVKICKKE